MIDMPSMLTFNTPHKSLIKIIFYFNSLNCGKTHIESSKLSVFLLPASAIDLAVEFLGLKLVMFEGKHSSIGYKQIQHDGNFLAHLGQQSI